MQENVEFIFTLQSRSLICEILKNTFSPFKSSKDKARMAKNRHTTDTANSQHLEKKWLQVCVACRGCSLFNVAKMSTGRRTCVWLQVNGEANTHLNWTKKKTPQWAWFAGVVWYSHSWSNAFTNTFFFFLEQCLSFRAVRRKKNLKAACWHFSAAKAHYFWESPIKRRFTLFSRREHGPTQVRRSSRHGTKRHCPVDTMFKNEKKLAHLVCCTCPEGCYRLQTPQAMCYRDC